MLRTHHLSALALLVAAPAAAQNPPIDLNQWTVEDINLPSTNLWTVDAPRQNAVYDGAFNDVSVLYSDFDVSFVDFRIRVDAAAGDDDFFGFVLGWDAGDANSPSADYLVVDWKRITQNFGDWGSANAGLAISQVQGQIAFGQSGGPIDLWSHTGACTELARSTNFGTTGWSFDTDYNFRVVFTPTNVVVFLNDVVEFNVNGTFDPGKFGFYNFSQNLTSYQFPIAGDFASYGSGCPGSAGTPFLFSPVAPEAGRPFPLILANVNPTGMPFVLVGLSDQTWAGGNLPFDLAPLGARGCTLLASPDLALPLQNFNGTGYLQLDIPAGAPVSNMPSLFFQGVATDPGANNLGLVFSNGGAATIGIR